LLARDRDDQATGAGALCGRRRNQRAQDEISKTLTDRYLQYLAIQAQKSVGTSGRNNTLIYLPSGTNGVPLVQDHRT